VVKRLAGAGISLSAIIDEALRVELHRLRTKALLDEMEARNPISPEERAAGEEIWRQIESSSLPEPSQRSRKKRVASAK
jgi:hypothetical protein